MDEFEISYTIEDAAQFWLELDDIISATCQTHELIDNALRAYLGFVVNFKGEYLQSEYDIAKCCYKLLESALFQAHKEYVRRQIVHALLQEDESPTLHIITGLLLYDGRSNEETFQMMQQEGSFPRLVELISQWEGEDTQLHRMLLDLMYESSRIQRLSWNDLKSISDPFILSLFSITESLSADASDPYHYPVIRVLLVLNEQYMVKSALSPPPPPPPRTKSNTATSYTPPTLTNRVLKALSTHLSSYKTFGENLILLLNRESETSLQLLILKLLYLVFSTKSTCEYFYTNDLHVLLDVILRNLLDLPSDDESMQALRHTYLRVLYPLLANSQLKHQGQNYKKPEITAVLRVLSGEGGNHFAEPDPTTVRLVQRCRSVEWLKEEVEGEEDGSAGEEGSETPVDKVGDGLKEVAMRSLGMGLRDAGESALSVVAVAVHTEKPGVLTPSLGLQHGGKGGANGGGKEGGDGGVT
ncbi:hypothetical protein EJ08DRAFT_735895 [Tothia fuscella]|uniref:SPIN90/Ldb17 leucine-rich domain-containing protein n=1 Tax=Tothia fuscella TaxID=1048955 RepID=A0A9P4NME2_9PEZI|nr:hypothetical protein EJ08DRAFT_735895 [Tothia fuscella]